MSEIHPDFSIEINHLKIICNTLRLHSMDSTRYCDRQDTCSYQQKSEVLRSEFRPTNDIQHPHEKCQGQRRLE